MRDKLSYYEKNSPHAPLSIISVPTELGSDARGLFSTPHYLRQKGLYELVAAIGGEISKEIGIACPSPRPNLGAVKNLKEILQVSRNSAQSVAGAGARGDIAVVLGGDHSTSIGSIAGACAAHSSIGVIWIDAHPDVHTDETSLTGNAHGMPAALAMGFGHSMLLDDRERFVQPENFLFIGAKDFDAAEIEFLRRESPPLFTMLDIAQRGLTPVFTAIESLSRRVEKVWISMDMDSLDRTYAPGVAMPNGAGLTAREALALAQYVGKVCNVAGFDIVEMLPAHDLDGKTAALALEIMGRLLGSEYSWYSEYMARYESSQTIAK